MKQIKVSVTQKHINKGCKTSGRACPIALALLDHFGVDRVEVMEERMIVYSELFHTHKTFRTARSASRFIKVFDNTGKGKPFNFFLGQEID